MCQSLGHTIHHTAPGTAAPSMNGRRTSLSIPLVTAALPTPSLRTQKGVLDSHFEDIRQGGLSWDYCQEPLADRGQASGARDSPPASLLTL